MSGATDIINQILLLLTLITALVVVILVLVAWSKITSMGFVGKILLAVAFGLVFLIVAVSLGWMKEEAITAAWEGVRARVLDLWMRYDGFTRSHRWIGPILLALTPFLLWPTVSELVKNEDE